MSTEIKIDLTDYKDECIEALEWHDYRVFEDDEEIEEYYHDNLEDDADGLRYDLEEYVKELDKIVNIYNSPYNKKNADEILEDLKNILEENK